MAVETNNLVIYQSEKLIDTPDGGGKYNGQQVADGISNNLFTDISELDRTMGDVSMRKVFAGLTNNDTASLMGASVFIAKNPDDPNVSALLFSTKSHTDTRAQAQSRVESYLAKGALAVGSLLETAYTGMKSIQVIMDKQEQENAVNDTLVLVMNEGLGTEVMQFVRITAVSTRAAYIRVDGKQVEVKIATYTLNDPLQADFVGVSALEWFNNAKPATKLRQTVVADSGRYYASVDLAQSAGVGDFTVMAKSIFAQLIPSAQTETPLVNLNAASQNAALVPANSSSITTSITTNIAINQSLYIGSSILPGSVTFKLFGTDIKDDGGLLRTIAGAQIGTIDYQNGLIIWTSVALGSGSTTFDLNFIPAAAVNRPYQSRAFLVTQNNQSLNWTGILQPLPAPGSVLISYMSQGKVYQLKDNGGGRLVGANTSIGNGTVSYADGSWLVTLGALPDVGTPILLLWGTPMATYARADSPVAPAGIDFQLFYNGIVSVTATWQLNGQTKTATTNSSGQFTGDATGYVRFNNGKGRLVPNVLPQKGSVFTLTYDYGQGKNQTVSTGAPAAGNNVSFTIGTGAAIKPGSVGLTISVAETNTIYYDTPKTDGTTGDVLSSTGSAVGTITYATGKITMVPSVTRIYPIVAYGNTGYFATQTATSFVSGKETLKAATDVTVNYRDTSGTGNNSESVTLNTLSLDLTSGFDEQILAGSVRFRIGADVYVDRAGSIYRNIDPVTGSGIASGTIQYGTGLVQLDSWTQGASNAFSLRAMTTTSDLPPANYIAFRTPTMPIRPGSLTFQVALLDGGNLTLTVNEDGKIEHEKAHGVVNFDTGFVEINFYTKTRFTSENRAGIEKQPWYSKALEYTDGGDTYINVPVWVAADTMRYSAIAYTYIPLDSSILGLSATRLPSDGRVPVFRVGDIGIVSSTKLQVLPDNIAGKTYDLPQPRLAWLELEDSTGKKVNSSLYTVDYDYGRVTLGGDFSMAGLTAPISARYRYQDMGLIRDVQINGQITFTKPLTHVYSPADTVVGSALVIGDMQSRTTNKFVQATWSSVFSDLPSGGAISVNYNDALFPLTVTNKGAISERWALVFTDTTTFRILGEVSGQIGTGTVNTDCAPINPATGAPYFVVKKDGWGSGWVSGNVLRFNTVSAMFPVWCIRTVKQSEPSVLSDDFQIMLRGDIDRTV